MPRCSASFHAISVCTSTPSTADTTNNARSAACNAAIDVADEVGVAGRVDHVDLVALELERGERERHRDVAALLFGIEVGDRRAVFDPAHAGDGAGAEQQRLGQGGLPGSAVAHEGDVADLGASGYVFTR